MQRLNLEEYDKVIHLSHVDMDGFGCSFLTKKFGDSLVTHINANYGEGVQRGIDRLVKIGESQTPNTLLLITDLGLTYEQCSALDAVISDDVDVRCIDHHPITDEIREEFSWYHQDASVSATSLLFNAILGYERVDSGVSALVGAISAYDTFNKNHRDLFSVGSAINNALYLVLSKIKPESELALDLITSFLDEIANGCKDNINAYTASYIENKSFGLWGVALGVTETQTVNEKLTELVGEATMNEEENIYTLTFNAEDHKCIIDEKIPMVSTVADYILHADKTVGYVISIDTKRGTVSLRSREASARLLAREMFGGNGHEKAAGGQIDLLITNDLPGALESLGFRK